MKETEEIMGMIKEEGAAYFARERGNKVEVGLYLEHIIEERGMKKKDIVRKLNLEESYARKLFGGQRIPTRKILLQCAFLLSLDLSDTQRLLDIGQKPRLLSARTLRCSNYLWTGREDDTRRDEQLPG